MHAYFGYYTIDQAWPTQTCWQAALGGSQAKSEYILIHFYYKIRSYHYFFLKNFLNPQAF